MVSFTVVLQGDYYGSYDESPEGIWHILLKKKFEMQCLPSIGHHLNCPDPLGKVERIHHNLSNGTIKIIFEKCSLDFLCQFFSGDNTWEISCTTKKEEAKFRRLCKEYKRIKKPREKIKMLNRLKPRQTQTT